MLATRILVGTLALALVGAGMHRVAEADRRAEAREQRSRTEAAAARAALDAEVGTLRTAAADVAAQGDRAATELVPLLTELVTGGDRDPQEVHDEVERHLAALERAATKLRAAAARPVPEHPAALPTGTTDPALDDLDHLSDQLATAAERTQDAATRTASLVAELGALQAAAAAFLADTDELPEAEDPDELAEVWRGQLDALEPYRAAASEAATSPALEPLATAHLRLLDRFAATAQAALDALEDGDVDTYNQRLDAAHAWSDGQVEELTAATKATAAVFTEPVTTAHAHLLGLLAELDAAPDATTPSGTLASPVAGRR